MGSWKEREKRIQQIRERLQAYHAHENDSYVYSPSEIEEVRELHAHAVEDIEFLLKELDLRPSRERSPGLKIG